MIQFTRNVQNRQICKERKLSEKSGGDATVTAHGLKASEICWESSRRWLQCLGPCAHTGDVDGAPGFGLLRPGSCSHREGNQVLEAPSSRSSASVALCLSNKLVNPQENISSTGNLFTK